MDQVKSLNGLIKSLECSNAEDYVQIAKNMNIPIEDFEKYIHWKEDGYSRNCIVHNEDYELILICWKNGDSTPIHGHDKQNCWVYQVDGQLIEKRFTKNNTGEMIETNQLHLSPGKLCYMHDDMGYHTLENTSGQSAMTLHLYMKPILKCAIFNDDQGVFVEKELSYYSVNGELQNALIGS